MLSVLTASLLIVLPLKPEDPVQSQASRLAVIRQAPEFELITHNGKKLRLVDLKGKVVLVSFVFTTCNGTYPVTTHLMCQIQGELKRRKLTDAGKVHLLSISLDPARDTPEALQRYLRLYDA